jgi:uncharacterized membrane protein YgcG
MFKQICRIAPIAVATLVIILILIFLGGLIAFLPLTVFVVILVVMIFNRRCPNCRKLTLKTRDRVLVPPTSRSNGTMRIIKHCNNPNCTYHREFEETYSNRGSRYNGGCDYGGGG